MKIKISLFIVSFVTIFLSGCGHAPAFMVPHRQTVEVKGSGEVFDGVIVTKSGNIYGASRDNMTVINNCPQGYYVDLIVSSKEKARAIASGKSKTFHPYSAGENEQQSFSAVVYTVDLSGEKTVVKRYNRIIRTGGARQYLTATWEVGLKSNSVKTIYTKTEYYSFGH